MKRRTIALVCLLLFLIGSVAVQSIAGNWQSALPFSGTAPIAQAAPLAQASNVYTNDHYGFSLRYPTGWNVQEVAHIVQFSRGSSLLQVSYRWLTEPPIPHDISNLRGTLTPQGTIQFQDKVILRRELISQDQVKAVYYHNDHPEISLGKLVLTAYLTDGSAEYESLDIPEVVQNEADGILESFETFLPQAVPAPLARQLGQDTDYDPLPTLTPSTMPPSQATTPADHDGEASPPPPPPTGDEDSPVPTPTPTLPPSPTPSNVIPPTPEATPIPTPDADFAAFHAQLAAMVNSWGNQNAVSVMDLQTGQLISINGARPQLAACTIKIGIMVAVAQDIERGLYTTNDVAGLVQSMMGPSNTYPARELLRITGGGDIGRGVHRVNQIMWDMGATGSLLTHPPGYPGEEYGYAVSHGVWDNLLTTDDLVMMLEAIYHGEMLTPHGTAYVLQSMTIAPAWMNYSFGAPLPAGVRLYHKVGQLYGPHNTWNDAGIVEFERNGNTYAYALAYLGSYGGSWQVSYNNAIAVSERVWGYFSQRYTE